MLISFFRWLHGYVCLTLAGYSPERFLNLCRARRIEIWDLQNTGTAYELCMSVRDFRKLRPLCRKVKARVRVKRRCGLPFFLYRNRSRKMFPVGLLLCACLLYVLSLYIWNIHIEGNQAHTTEVILEYLESEQVVHGMKKSEVDCKEIQSRLRIAFPDIIWVSAQVKGTRLLIRVRENTDVSAADEAQEENSPGDLLASRAGLITSVLVRSGTALVQAGDEVEEGALLVQGRVALYNDSGEETGANMVTADADVYARTEYVYEDTFPLSHETRYFTGKKRWGFSLQAGNRSFTLGLKPHFSQYTTLHTDYPVRLTENFYLPLVFGRTVYEEYETRAEKYTAEEARLLAETKLHEFLENLEQKGVQIAENNVTIEVGRNTCTASGTITALEDIGSFAAAEETAE